MESRSWSGAAVCFSFRYGANAACGRQDRIDRLFFFAAGFVFFGLLLDLVDGERVIELRQKRADKRVFKDAANGRPHIDVRLFEVAFDRDDCGEAVLRMVFEDLSHACDDGFPKLFEDVLASFLFPLEHVEVFKERLDVAFVTAFRGGNLAVNREVPALDIELAVGAEKSFRATRFMFVTAAASLNVGCSVIGFMRRWTSNSPSPMVLPCACNPAGN